MIARNVVQFVKNVISEPCYFYLRKVQHFSQSRQDMSSTQSPKCLRMR